MQRTHELCALTAGTPTTDIQMLQLWSLCHSTDQSNESAPPNQPAFAGPVLDVRLAL